MILKKSCYALKRGTHSQRHSRVTDLVRCRRSRSRLDAHASPGAWVGRRRFLVAVGARMPDASDAWARGVPRLGAATHLPIAPSVRTATSGGSSSTGASDSDRAPCKGPDEILQHVHEFAHAATWLSRQRSAARCGVGRRADQCLDVTEVADVIRCMYGERVRARTLYFDD